MFDNLVESSTHKADIQRKGGFFLGTLAAYTLLLAVIAVGSIYLVDANVTAQNLELTTLVAPVPFVEPPAAQPVNQPQPQTTSDQSTTPTRKIMIANTDNPNIAPDKISSIASDTPPAPIGARIDNRNYDPPINAGLPSNATPGGGVNPTNTGTPPPLPDPTPKPDPTPVAPPRNPPVKSGGVLNGKSITKPQLVYPPIAKSAGVQGVVVVQILIDEKGKVISATAVSGPVLLREAAVRAAYQARFEPTTLSNQPVKVSGTYSFNFTINR